MTRSEFLKALRAYRVRYPNTRVGQAAVNLAYDLELKPKAELDALLGTEADPYYETSKLTAFFNALDLR